jgi:FtsP/CotA-like multicopper oxidase with cupredoxin domain
MVAAGVLGYLWANGGVGTVRTEATVRLPIPPLAASRVVDGRRVFDLRATEGRHDFGAGKDATRTWGFNGGYLGPTLRARQGEQVQVNVTNGLGEVTTVHWHGHHLPAAMDGGPHQVLEPGETWRPRWRIDQPAATTWYHPHPHGSTADHMYRGLAGLFILDRSSPGAPGLPSEYGVDDVPLIVQDKAFDGDGQLDDDSPVFSPVGFLGETIVVNGAIGAYHEVTTERVRLRILNASNARVYDFGLHDDREFALIGTDGGLLPAPHKTRRVLRHEDRGMMGPVRCGAEGPEPRSAAVGRARPRLSRSRCATRGGKSSPRRCACRPAPPSPLFQLATTDTGSIPAANSAGAGSGSTTGQLNTRDGQ